MLPFPIDLRPGDAPVKQVVRAATRAILSGVLQPGDRFPSVRDLAEALRIHPNSAQKVIAQLQQDGLVIARPGVGTVVQATPAAPPADPRRSAALETLLDQLVVEARRAGLDEPALGTLVTARWRAAFGPTDPSAHPASPAATTATTARHSVEPS